MANQILLGRALDANGYIAPGAKATIYADGTSTLIPVYSDVDGTTPAANPIIADGNGFWPQRYVSEDAKVVVTDANDVALYTLDPAPTSAGTGAAASAISFSPTIQLPQTNVQAAIEAAGALAVSGFAAFGLGVTGNAALLANLDATGTGAGIYRFDGTTTGTYPTGVAAGDTGMVELWRQAGATAMMELHHATSNRVFRRRLTATVWGAWREVLNVNQATVQGDLVQRGASDFARLPIGSFGQALVVNSAGNASEWGGIGVLSAAVSTATGTTISLASGLPSWARKINLYWNLVSLDGTDNFLVQLGNSGGFITTGYTGSTSGGVNTVATSTAGLVVLSSVINRTATGRMSLTRVDTTTNHVWISEHSFGQVADTTQGGGSLSFTGPLTQIRLNRTGTNNYNNGNVYVEYSA